jgi:hypothetical protein
VRSQTCTAALLLPIAVLAGTAAAARVEPPQWLLEQAAVTVSDRDADAVALLRQRELAVTSGGSETLRNRVVYRILRPDGAARGTLVVVYGDGERITRLHGWCIPASGQPYEVSEKEATDSGVSRSIKVPDARKRTLVMKGIAPGSLIGFEWTIETPRPLLHDHGWQFQDDVPSRLAQFTLVLPASWHYAMSWHNHTGGPETNLGHGRWQWTLRDVSAIPVEPAMPPYEAVAGRLHVSYDGPRGPGKSFQSWSDLGAWALSRDRGRDDPSADIRATVAEVTAGTTDTLARVQAIARFVQDHVRYVAVELGIGGFQPHVADEILKRRYGDSTDHTALLVSMLKVVGIQSHYVLVNTRRGMVEDGPAPELRFNHVITAIELPEDAPVASLSSIQQDPAAGRLLYFDSTDPFTPLGRLRADLQSTNGLLVLPAGGNLRRLPEEPVDASGVKRQGAFSLDQSGTLSGELSETIKGDRANEERQRLSRQSDRTKLVEPKLAGSLSSYRILRTALDGAEDNREPLKWHYSFEAEHYAQPAGNLLLVRPRVMGIMSIAPLPAAGPRHNPITLTRRGRDTDELSIVLPAGYRVDELPPSVDLEQDFGSYHSRTTVEHGVLHYTRSVEIRRFQIPPADADALRRFSSAIDADERAEATFTKGPPAHGPAAGG